MKESKELTILRILLACGGFGWFISVFGIFMPWSWISEQLKGLGASAIPHDPMLDYWLRMAAGAFTCIGAFFFLLAAYPRKYAAMIPVAASFLLIEGAILLGAHFALRLALLPSLFDAAFCLIIGAGIFLSKQAAVGKAQYRRNY